jgi:hypothetical protein
MEGVNMRIIVVAVILLLSIPSAEGRAIGEGDQPISGMAGLCIGKEDLRAFEEMALSGDADAAHRLSTFQRMCT